MKKAIIAALTLILIIAGCGKKDGKTTPAEDKKPKTTQSENLKKSENKDETKDSEQKSSKNDSCIKNKHGETVTADDLSKLIEKANDPSTDEETKKELLNEIDYILKQAEQ